MAGKKGMRRKAPKDGFKWKPLGSGNAHKWGKEGEVLEGIYSGLEQTQISEGKGKKRKTCLLLFKTDEGMVKVWDSRVLASVKELAEGTRVRITYRGKVKKGLRSYHNFDVQYAE